MITETVAETAKSSLLDVLRSLERCPLKLYTFVNTAFVKGVVGFGVKKAAVLGGGWVGQSLVVCGGDRPGVP
jgi:hypothetical protein